MIYDLSLCDNKLEFCFCSTIKIIVVLLPAQIEFCWVCSFVYYWYFFILETKSYMIVPT